VALVPETKVIRSGTVISGRYLGSGEVELTVEVGGQKFTVLVHAETAARFHCGAAFSMTLAVA
jgi:hypothetical protein